MKIWIIEDEKALVKSLESQLKRLRPDIVIAGTSSNIEDSVNGIMEHQDLDIIFADIKIDDGMSFTVFDTVETQSMVVFTTAYDEYALKAFEYNCADYLLKPIKTDELERALSKCERREERISSSSLKTMAGEIIRGEVKYRKMLLLDTIGGGTIYCPVEDIAYIFTVFGTTRVYKRDGSFATTLSSLKDLMDGLDPSKFCRISRQAILNGDFIETVTRGPGRDFTVTLRQPFETATFKMTAERTKELRDLLNK